MSLNFKPLFDRNRHGNILNSPKALKLAVFAWSVLFLVLMALQWNNIRQDAVAMARITAEIGVENDMSYREWFRRAGGIYIAPAGMSQGSLHMESTPGDSATVEEHRALTRVNAACLMREVYASRGRNSRSSARMISLSPVNPANAPDLWEARSLRSLNEADGESTLVDTPGDGSVVRLLSTLRTENDCLKCHTGSVEGQNLGAVSVIVPLKPFVEKEHDEYLRMLPKIVALWVVGLLGIGVMHSRLAAYYGENAELARLNRVTLAEIEETGVKLEAVRQRLISIFDASNDGFWEWDSATGIMTMSPRLHELLGYNPDGGEGEFSSWQVCLDPDMQKESEKKMEACQWGGAAEYYMKQRLRTRSGEWVWVLNRGKVLQRDESGRGVTIGGAVTDITLLRLSEENLLMANQQLDRILTGTQKAAERKSRFLAALTHDLRTPLHAILGGIELLRSSRLSERQLLVVSTIQESGSHLDALIGDTLDISRIESGRLELAQAPFDLQEAVEKAVGLLRMEIQRKGLALHLDLPSVEDTTVLGDEKRLTQVLCNLLGNAVKFTERGWISVGMSLQEDGAESVLVEIVVADTGKGIAPERQPRIFDSYTQEDNAIHGTYGGTGLGLAICRHLVRLMGGEISVESQVGVGSTFRFTVRLTRGMAAMPHTSDPPPPGGAGERETSLRILLAEDNPANRFVTSELLKQMGHAVKMVEDGQQAVELSELEPFDLILMDIQMPVMDGRSATELIRKREGSSGGRLPIFAMTANANPEDRHLCIKAGMDAYITKPINMRDLVNALEGVPSAMGSVKGHVEGQAAPDAEVFDLAGALDLYGGDRTILDMVIKIFAKEYPTIMQSLKEDIENGDLHGVRRTAHRLKGTLSQLDARSSSSTAFRLQEAAERNDGNQCRITMGVLEEELRKLWEALQWQSSLSGRLEEGTDCNALNPTQEHA